MGADKRAMGGGLIVECARLQVEIPCGYQFAGGVGEALPMGIHVEVACGARMGIGGAYFARCIVDVLTRHAER